MSTPRTIDHEKFLGTMKSVARAQEMQNNEHLKKENKIVSEEKTCMTCDKKRTCKVFNGRMSTIGVYSVGGDVVISSCNKWAERKDKPSDPKKIKSLLKHFSNLRLK